MSGQHNRLALGGKIDRSQLIKFTFNGRAFTGFSGDTLASALLANGVDLTARSFRYHRRRSILSAGPEEPHAIVRVGDGDRLTPNVRATQQLLFEGLAAKSQTGWPSPEWDFSALAGWITQSLPVGFYYKTFTWPSWNFYEGFIRRAAGAAPVSELPDPDQYDKRYAHCDLLVIGAGPAGLAAAHSAALSGAYVIIADDQPEPGGSLLWRHAKIDGGNGEDWARQATSQLRRLSNVTILSSTTIAAAWDHGYFVGVEHRPSGVGSLQRLWKIRCKRSILATGAAERPMVFPDNDRPGIMLADAVRRYANHYAVLPGKRAALYTNNNHAYTSAFDLQDKGLQIEAIIDTRQEPGEAGRLAEDRNITVFRGHEIVRTHGRRRLSSIALRPIDAASGAMREINLDLLLISGGWSPVVHLFSQQGGKLVYDEVQSCFAPIASPSEMTVIGAAKGEFSLRRAIKDGNEAGADMTGSSAPPKYKYRTPHCEDVTPAYRIAPHWRTENPEQGRQWIDFYHDVTADGIDTAIDEGYVSVEHLKRYTTTGMAPDQGKTSNINALGNLAEHTDRQIADVGTTTFRPPFTPVRLGALAGRETGPRAWPVRRLPLHEFHFNAGGVMEDHSGWLRPAYYPQDGETEREAIDREVIAARNSIALFDSSSLGKIEVRGPDAGAFLNRIYINNVLSLKTGRARYGMMLNENGVIIDDGVFARLSDQAFLVSASSAGVTDVYLALEEWLQTEWSELDVAVYNATTQWATFAVSGPKSRLAVSEIIKDQDLGAKAFPHMSVREGDINGIPYRLMRVSFTGELSFELNIPAGYAEAVWKELLKAGEPHSATLLGMEALDILRLEKGYLEVGVDTDGATSPLDVGWGPAIAKKKADFIGKRSLSRPDNLRPDRHQLVGVTPVSPEMEVPVGAHILSGKSGCPEGHITSAAQSPTLSRSVALGLLRAGQKRLGEEVVIDVNGRPVPARVVQPSFFDPDNLRLSY